MFPGADVIALQLGQQLVLAAVQQQLRTVLLKPFALVLGQERRGVGAERQLVDKDNHLLPVREGLLHKIKGGFQRIAGGGNGLLAAAHLTVEGTAHRIKRLVGVELATLGGQVLAPLLQQGQRAGAGRGFFGQQSPGGFVSLQTLTVMGALVGKQRGGVGVRLLGQRALEAAQLLVAGIRHRTRGAGVGKAGVQARHQSPRR